MLNTDYVRLFHVWAPLFWSTPRYSGRVVESIHRYLVVEEAPLTQRYICSLGEAALASKISMPAFFFLVVFYGFREANKFNTYFMY